MQFSTALFAAAAFAVAQAALITNTPQDFVGVTVGTTFDITWSNATGPVTLLLKNGPANALQTVTTIVSGQTGTSYPWSIPASLPVGYYAFEIDDSDGVNYSIEFLISGGPSSTSSAVSSMTTAASSSLALSSGSTVTSMASSSSTTSGISSSNSNSTASGASSSARSTHASTTTTSTSSHASSTSTSAPNASVNSAVDVASPLAFVFLALAAILTIN